MGMALVWDKEGLGCVGFGNVAGCLRFQHVHFVTGGWVKDGASKMLGGGWTREVGEIGRRCA